MFVIIVKNLLKFERSYIARGITLIFSNKIIRSMREAEMSTFNVYFGNMNFAFLNRKGILLKTKIAKNFGR